MSEFPDTPISDFRPAPEPGGGRQKLEWRNYKHEEGCLESKCGTYIIRYNEDTDDWLACDKYLVAEDGSVFGGNEPSLEEAIAACNRHNNPEPSPSTEYRLGMPFVLGRRDGSYEEWETRLKWDGRGWIPNTVLVHRTSENATPVKPIGFDEFVGWKSPHNVDVLTRRGTVYGPNNTILGHVTDNGVGLKFQAQEEGK